jgi:hypothetical protein
MTSQITEREIKRRGVRHDADLREDAIAMAFVEDGCQTKNLPAIAEHLGIKLDSAQKIFARPRFQAKVRQFLTGKLQHLELSGDRVLQELASIGFMKIGDVFDRDGNMIPPQQLPAHVQAAVKQIEVESKLTYQAVKRNQLDNSDVDGDDGELPAAVPMRTVVTRYRFHDKPAALQMLARHFKLVDQAEEGVNAFAMELANRLKQARMRETNPQPVEDATIIEAAEPPEPPTPQESPHEEPLW